MTLTVRRLPDLNTAQLKLMHDLLRDYIAEANLAGGLERAHNATEIRELYAARREFGRCLS